ncbi:MAG: hypothetical protein DRI95_10930 [Bacteroidetes bacterium]|nr:MAG: hypothetical protein DRI95_10930 [Bacteroidota bacterium]
MYNIQKFALSFLFMAIFVSCKESNTKTLPSISAGNGMASWYGPGFHGKFTANGEKFNMNKFTAAHRELKFGTLLKVTNLGNKFSVIVRVNDRGPFKHNRIIDLSKKAAKEIDMIKSGIADVKIEIIGYKVVNFESLYNHFRNLLITNSEQ